MQASSHISFGCERSRSCNLKPFLVAGRGGKHWPLSSVSGRRVNKVKMPHRAASTKNKGGGVQAGHAKSCEIRKEKSVVPTRVYEAPPCLWYGNHQNAVLIHGSDQGPCSNVDIIFPPACSRTGPEPLRNVFQKWNLLFVSTSFYILLLILLLFRTGFNYCYSPVRPRLYDSCCATLLRVVE